MKETTAYLRDVAAIGPYFAVRGGEIADAAGFRPLAELYASEDGRPPAPLVEYVERVRQRLGTDQTRVAASTVHLGIASRLWSIALASAALAGAVPDLSPGRLSWRPSLAGPVELWLPHPRDLQLSERTPQAAAVHTTVAVHNLEPLRRAVHRVGGVSDQVLHGNAASALVGALRVLLTRTPAAPKHVVPTALELVGTLLDREPLHGTGSFRCGPDGFPVFSRRSCCLYYRVPGAGTCGDCVLRNRPRSRNGHPRTTGSTTPK
ncbi:(2Fe-2S)-binding protein [Streptomyces sp. KR80]|uniref:(2Fe-2S)-binding protein n=1 Tax=Streptomyces sp. KR80 TaxID=3457426 RepID=UPI003FD1BD31